MVIMVHGNTQNNVALILSECSAPDVHQVQTQLANSARRLEVIVHFIEVARYRTSMLLSPPIGTMDMKDIPDLEGKVGKLVPGIILFKEDEKSSLPREMKVAAFNRSCTSLVEWESKTTDWFV